MGHWHIPALFALVCWGLWAFIPKITIRYIDPKSAIVYEAVGAGLVAVSVFGMLGFKPAIEGHGVVLAIMTGILGVLGSLGYFFAVVKGPVILISTLTALYPVLVIILANVILQEPVSLKQGIGVIMAFYARFIHLIFQHNQRKDEAGRFARLLIREMTCLCVFLGVLLAADGISNKFNND